MIHAGAAVICLGLIIWGFKRSNDEKQRIEIICEVERLIRYMSGNILHYRKSLPDIFEAFDSPLLEECGFAQGLADGWQTAVLTIDCPAIVKKELLNLGEELGMMNTERQLDCFERCLSCIGEYTLSEKQSLSSKMLIYRCLGLTAAAAIFILTL